jgi:hypothetical protein
MCLDILQTLDIVQIIGGIQVIMISLSIYKNITLSNEENWVPLQK